MLDVCLMGTGGSMPKPDRWLSSLLVRYEGKSLVIDCGEGTQLALKESGFNFNFVLAGSADFSGVERWK